MSYDEGSVSNVVQLVFKNLCPVLQCCVVLYGVIVDETEAALCQDYSASALSGMLLQIVSNGQEVLAKVANYSPFH